MTRLGLLKAQITVTLQEHELAAVLRQGDMLAYIDKVMLDNPEGTKWRGKEVSELDTSEWEECLEFRSEYIKDKYSIK